jgi:arabinofuranan 3-O-arabinosyltransferase
VVDRRLLLEDPTSVLIDGRVVSHRPPLSLPLTDPHVLAVQAGSRTVSLDHGPVTLPIGAATTLTTYRPAAVPARVSPFSEVADCNNYQPRPADQLGLVRQQARGVLRLAALDHAACSTATVLNAVPGHTYRVRLDYKRVAGARPQICVLQVGSDGCDLAPQQSMSSEWTPYENFVTLGPAAQGLQIVLHADVGLRFAARSVEEYRGLTVESLDITKPQTVWPPAVPETSVELAAGPHQISVVGGPAGTVLTGFEGLQDCFNSDSRTAEQAGLHFSEDTTETGDITYSLGAVAHLACIGSGTDDYGADSLYELSMEAESVAVRNPKFCLYLRGPNLCQTLPSVAHWDGWTTYQTLVKPDATAVDTLLYLYGLRDLEEKQRSEVQYRQVKLRPVASPETVVLVRDQPDLPASDAAWSRSNAADFPVEVTGTGPAMLALVEGAAPGWALQGKDAAKGTHLTLQGWLNGWRLTGPVTGTLAYQPAHLSRYALYLLPVTVVAAAFWTWRQARRRRRRT